jgi:hypothetical protein
MWLNRATSLIIAAYIITNAIIAAGVIRHWNDNNTSAELQIQVEVQDSSKN